MKRLLLIIILSIPAITCCTPYSTRLVDDDFLETPGDLAPEEIEERIAALREASSCAPDSAGIHRELSVLYRMQGTPYSRASAIREIDRAISLAPDDPLNHVEKGLTLHAMRFDREAAASMKRAIELDPGCFHAWYQLARMEKERYLLNMCFSGHRDNAIRYYKKAYNLDGDHEDTLFNLALLHLLRNMTRTSAKYAGKAASLYPSEPRHRLLLGSIALREGRFGDASDRFEEALALMDEKVRRYYLEVLPVIDEKTRAEYQKWPVEQRLSWSRRYWTMNDPTPATPVNERLLTHYERVFLARELLTSERLDLDGIDTARGYALICYGLPDKFLYNLGGGLNGAVVIWEYSGPGRSFRLFFQDEFLNGDYHIPIDPNFAGMARATQSVFDSVPQSYEYPVIYSPVEIGVVTAQTRSASNRTRIDISVALPDSSLGGGLERFECTLSIFDRELTRLVNSTVALRADTLPSVNKLGTVYRYFLMPVEILPPAGECTFALELTGGKPFKRGSWNAGGTIEDFSGDALRISDVRLLLTGEGGSCGRVMDPLPVYVAGSSICIGYEIFGLTRGEKYMSRYRLTYTIKSPPETDEGLHGLRRMFYWIARSARGGKDRERPFITSSFEQSVASSLVDDTIRIDLGSLEPGRYFVEVSVDDLVSGKSASVDRGFVIEAP